MGWVCSVAMADSAGMNLRTVSMPGLGVNPCLILQSVGYGTPDPAASWRSWAWLSLWRLAPISEAEGIFASMARIIHIWIAMSTIFGSLIG